jgi:hypothetical protein
MMRIERKGALVARTRTDMMTRRSAENIRPLGHNVTVTGMGKSAKVHKRTVSIRSFRFMFFRSDDPYQRKRKSNHQQLRLQDILAEALCTRRSRQPKSEWG